MLVSTPVEDDTRWTNIISDHQKRSQGKSGSHRSHWPPRPQCRHQLVSVATSLPQRLAGPQTTQSATLWSLHRQSHPGPSMTTGRRWSSNLASSPLSSFLPRPLRRPQSPSRRKRYGQSFLCIFSIVWFKKNIYSTKHSCFLLCRRARSQSR